MSLDWIGYHGLKGDPFSAIPLESQVDFQYVFVKTEEVAQHIDPLAQYFRDSAPNLTVLGGLRGVGKSTILHYLYGLLSGQEGVIPVYVRQEAAVQKLVDPVYGIGSDTVGQIIRFVQLNPLNSRFDNINRKNIRQTQQINNISAISGRTAAKSYGAHEFNTFRTNRCIS